ncbi:hypothetical protein SM033_00172 [Vibrio phage vB_VpaM_sm033]|nr:hypothetical protein SM033_00172 [Vibrio phage vB_VpaM_sm033]
MSNIDFLWDEDENEYDVDRHARPEEEQEEDYEDGHFMMLTQ